MSAATSIADAMRRDDVRGGGYILTLLFGFLVFDRLLLRLADHTPETLGSAILVLASVAEHPVEATLLAAIFAGIAIAGRERAWQSWEILELGHVARAVAAGAAAWLAWGASGYAFNYVLDSWHVFDRIVVAALAFGVAFRPIFLLPFLLSVRVVNGQFEYPIGADFAEAAEEISVLALLLISAAHLLYVAARSWRPSVVLLISSTIVVSHFFEPGIGKLRLDWSSLNRIAELPLNARAAGWMAYPDGTFAERLARMVSAADGPIRLATMIMELGAIAAVAHYRLLRLWLPAFMVFHLATFAMTGFFFPDWFALEAGLLFLLTRGEFRTVVERNATPARAIIAVVLVAIGGALYHPPRLAWLDAPHAYGYEIHGIFEDKSRHRLAPSDLAPFASDVLFGTLSFTPRSPSIGGYGAVATPVELEALRAVSDLAGLEALERAGGGIGADRRTMSEGVLLAFFDDARRGDRVRLPRWLSRPSRFWDSGTSRGANQGETLMELHVTQVVSIASAEGRVEHRRPLLRITATGGRGQVSFRSR